MRRERLQTMLKAGMTRKQAALMKKHGTPAEFAQAVYRCVPGDISMDEARTAVEKYSREWDKAGQRPKAVREDGRSCRCCSRG